MAERGSLAGRRRPDAGGRGLPAPEEPARLGAEELTLEALPFLRFEAEAQELFDTWRAALEQTLARRGGASGPALALREVSLADAVAGADRAADRRRGRRHERTGGARRGGAGHRLVHLPGSPRAPALRDADRRGAGGGGRARDQDHARSGGEPVHRPRGVSERMGGPDGAPGRPGRPRGPRRARLDSGGSGEGPGRRAAHRAVPHQPAAPGGPACPIAPRASGGVREPLTSLGSNRPTGVLSVLSVPRWPPDWRLPRIDQGS